MSTVTEHLDLLVKRRAEIYARCELVNGVNHMELECDERFVFLAKLMVAVHLDELLALAAPASPAATTSPEPADMAARLKDLILNFGDACFWCGEYQGEDSDAYRKLSAMRWSAYELLRAALAPPAAASWEAKARTRNT